jgi:HPt (histidine-containing phosphotransfer) domain-containing protein
MNDYLSKPFEEGALIKKICDWVGAAAGADGFVGGAAEGSVSVVAEGSVSVVAEGPVSGAAEGLGRGAADCPAGGAAGENGGLYGLGRLEEIAQGNGEFLQKMMQLFVDTVPALVEELRMAAANGNFQLVYAKAHSLKPSLHNFSIDTLQEDVVELERLAKAKDPSGRMNLLAQRVGDVVGKVVEGLREDILG